MVFAHDVGAAIGDNPYKSADTVRDSIVARLVPDADIGATESVAVRKEEAVRAALEDTAAVARAAEALGLKPVDVGKASKEDVRAAALDVVAHAAATIETSSGGSAGGASAAETYDSLRNSALAELPAVADAARAVAYTSLGTRSEDAALCAYCKERGVAASKPSRFVKRIVARHAKFPLWVGGYVDGLQGDDTVVEIKCRQRRFFDTMPRRELAQIYTYMYVTRRRKAVWVQEFRGAVRWGDVEWDQGTWDSIAASLLEFHGGVVKVLESLIV